MVVMGTAPHHPIPALSTKFKETLYKRDCTRSWLGWYRDNTRMITRLKHTVDNRNEGGNRTALGSWVVTCLKETIYTIVGRVVSRQHQGGNFF